MQTAAIRGSSAAASAASQPPALLPHNPTRPSQLGSASAMSTNALMASVTCSSR